MFHELVLFLSFSPWVRRKSRGGVGHGDQKESGKIPKLEERWVARWV